jgi:hypothetical protein
MGGSHPIKNSTDKPIRVVFELVPGEMISINHDHCPNVVITIEKADGEVVVVSGRKRKPEKVYVLVKPWDTRDADGHTICSIEEAILE